MTDNNPYDFLSGDAPVNGASPEHSETAKSAHEEHAPDATVPRADSVAALAARESHPPHSDAIVEVTGEANGQSDVDLATIPELAPLADLPADAVELQSAPTSEVELATTPYDPERAVLEQEPDPNAPKDVELGLFEHLGELRLRILHAVGAVMVAMAVTWSFVPQFQEWLLAPVGDIPIVQLDPMAGLTTYIQLSMISGLIISAPYVILQAWLFLVPALTGNEKRYVGFLLPFSIILFFLGCALAYVTSPLFFQFFRAFTPAGVNPQWEYQTIILLLGKTLLVFGVCFQVPIITIFLNKTGIVSRNILIEYWRHVVIVIFVVVSILTPTWDPITLLVCAVPPCLLYALSIWLIKWL